MSNELTTNNDISNRDVLGLLPGFQAEKKENLLQLFGTQKEDRGHCPKVLYFYRSISINFLSLIYRRFFMDMFGVNIQVYLSGN